MLKITKHFHKMLNLRAVVLSLIVFACSANAYAQFSDAALDYTVTQQPLENGGFVQDFKFAGPAEETLTYQLSHSSYNIADNFDYSGMAIYLGLAPAVKIMENGRVETIKIKDEVTVSSDGEWTGFKGRFKTVLARSQSGDITLTKDGLTIVWAQGVTPDLTIVTGSPDITSPPSLEGLPDLRDLQYVHLPRWMRVLCKLVEGLYKGIYSMTGLGWGLSLFVFAIIIKIILSPVTKLTSRFQNEANAHKSALEPIFADIKKSYKGEVAHNKTMAAYKARGITPYYSLKPFLSAMISLPVLIAIFNMLGEIEPLREGCFLWIERLAYPDGVAQLPATLPVFGPLLNLLPFVMAGVTFLSAYFLKSATASQGEINRQKRNLVVMGSAFFVIFYPFPSAMVLYWTLSTALQLVANKFMKGA